MENKRLTQSTTSSSVGNMMWIYTRDRLIKHRKIEYRVNFTTDGVPILTQGLILRLRSAKGVQCIEIKPYEIFVVKGDMFSWEEILPEIKAALVTFLHGWAGKEWKK